MRRVHFAVAAVIAISLLSGCGERQGIISGVVADSALGTPLSGTTVSIGEYTARTGPDGHYQLHKVPPGSYTLTARIEGYNPYQRQLDVRGGQEVVLDINLSRLEEPTPFPIAEEGQGPHRVIERMPSAMSPREGGSIVITEAESIYSNGFTLSIPPDALEEDTVITVGDVTEDFPPIPEGLRPVGLPVSLQPHGLAFQRAVTVKVPYSNEMLAYAGVTSPEDLLPKTYDLSTNEWTDVPIVQVDTQNRAIVAEIDHFSLFSLFSWWDRKETENPATNEQILTYINDSWGVVATVDDLARWNPNTEIPFKDEIGGILTVMSMAEQIQNEEYRTAAITGGEWLAWQALKLAGYGWLRPFALLVEVTYKGAVWFVKELDEGAFNAQLCAYLYYRREGYSVEDIKHLFVTDDEWVLTAMGTGCPPGYPRLTGRFEPEDVFRIGGAIWDARQSGSYKQRDTESIRDAFIDSIRPVEPNQPPQVHIISPSEKANVTAGEVVNLEGTAADPEDGPLTEPSLTWRIETAGSSTFLGEGGALSLSDLSVGTHRIFLTAKDSQGQTAEDSIEIIVQATVNTPPEVSIITPSDGSVFLEGDPILFTGSAIDPEDGPLADRSLIWVSGIDSVLGLGHTVTRDDLSPGTHAITLSATDSHSMFATKTVTIMIQLGTLNRSPIADAGSDQTVYVGADVTLDGSASSDPDDDPLTFRWVQSGGPSADVSDLTSSTLRFTPLTVGTYSFQLSVSDGMVVGLPALVSVTVLMPNAVGRDDAVGEYLNPIDPDDRLEINSDGICYMKVTVFGVSVGTTGRWELEDAQISLIFPDGTTFRGTVKADAIVFEDFGMLPVVWIKPTKSPPRVLDVAGRYVKEDHPDEYLVLNANGTYTKTERGFADQLWTESGDWELDNHAVLLRAEDWDMAISVAVLENCLYFAGLFGTEVWKGEPREEPTPVAASPEPGEEAIPSGKPPEVAWEQAFDTGGADFGIGVQELSEGGYVVLALTMPEMGSWFSRATWVIRTDEFGVITWDRLFIESNAVASSIQQTRDGGYVLVGTTLPVSGGYLVEDVWLAKLDQYGNTEWERTFGGPEEWTREAGSSALETDDGGYILVGEAVGVWLVKTDRRGNKEWDTSFTGDSRDWGLSVEQTNDGGYIIGGLSFRETGSRVNEDIWLIKTDRLGRKEWARFFGGESTESVSCVRQTRDGGYIIVGTTESPEPDLGWYFNLWLIKTDASGNELWNKTYGRVPEREPAWVSETHDGGYIVSTSSYERHESGELQIMLWLLKTEASGSVQWSKTIGTNAMGPLHTMGPLVEQTRDNGYITVGSDSTGRGGSDVWLVKLRGESSLSLVRGR